MHAQRGSAGANALIERLELVAQTPREVLGG
jgi:hypothetical protein